jgi:hypothetical protein
MNVFPALRDCFYLLFLINKEFRNASGYFF